FFSEDRLCSADNALRLCNAKRSERVEIAFRHLFSDGDVLAKFEIGFLLRDIKRAADLKREAVSSRLAQLLRRRVLIGQSAAVREVSLANAGKSLATFYCKATTHRPRGVKGYWSKLMGVIASHDGSSCFAGQPFVSVNAASLSAKKPESGRV